MVLSILFSWASVDATLLRLITSLLGWIAAKASLPEKIPIPWAQGFDLRAVFQSLAR